MKIYICIKMKCSQTNYHALQLEFYHEKIYHGINILLYSRVFLFNKILKW